MDIIIHKQEQPEFKTATEVERWTHFQQKNTVIITMTAMERQNLEQELKDVLSNCPNTFFHIQTRMTLYELYKAISGGKIL